MADGEWLTQVKGERDSFSFSFSSPRNLLTVVSVCVCVCVKVDSCKFLWLMVDKRKKKDPEKVERNQL